MLESFTFETKTAEFVEDSGMMTVNSRDESKSIVRQKNAIFY